MISSDMYLESNWPAGPGPIGVFDSGYGGLTILDSVRETLPEYDYIYLGDNARAPYGTRSFDVVYEFTLQAVRTLFGMGCHLVVLACNTASAKALRTIQTNDLPRMQGSRKVLGVIRPMVEAAGKLTSSGHIGILATEGTVSSESYPIEIKKRYPGISVESEACPMWVPLIENNEFNSPGADFFLKKHIDNILGRDGRIDTLILACTHYPLIKNKLKEFVPSGVRVISQEDYVARSLRDYLQRHPEVEAQCTRGGTCRFYTTEAAGKFAHSAEVFIRKHVDVESIVLV